MQTSDVLSIGQKLLRERRRLCWSQQQVADAIGTSTMSINRWEHGKAIPQPHYQGKLCNIFGKQTEDLFGSLWREEEKEAGEQPRPHHLIWNVPYPHIDYFPAHEELLTSLYTSFASSVPKHMPHIAALTGLGGVGKTQLTIEYVYRYYNEYDTILWLNAHTAELLYIQLASVVKLLNPTLDRTDIKRHGVIQPVFHWLSTHKSWLLICDGVTHMQDFLEFLPPFSNGHIILTTRLHTIGAYIHHNEVQTLSREESVLFLLRNSKFIPPTLPLESIPPSLRRDAETICNDLGGLPLALDQAVCYITANHYTLQHYMRLYKYDKQNILKQRSSINEYTYTVSTIWQAFFQKIEQTKLLARDLLRLLCFLDDAFIDEAILIAYAAKLGSHFLHIANDPLLLNDAVSELQSESLIQRDSETKAISINRLVQTVYRDTLDENTQKLWAERATIVIST